MFGRITFGLMMALVASSALAETFWLSEVGYCGADPAVIEDNDIIYLTERGISTHWFSCEWPAKVGRSILRGEQEVSTNARCANATSTWDAELTIVQQGDGSVRVNQESGGISPVRFFRCE